MCGGKAKGVELTHEQGHLVSDLGWGQGRFWGGGWGPVLQGKGGQEVFSLLGHGAAGTPLQLGFHICKMGFRTEPIF